MISIIIPTFGEEGYIGDALSKLVGNVPLAHEIIVTDDASLDGTVEAARQFPVRVISHKTRHISIGANRNSAARLSTGDLIVFLDADSRIPDPETFFKRAEERLDHNPGLVALTGTFKVLPAIETTADRIVYAVFNFIHRLKNNILHIGEAPGKFMMIRRRAFEAIGGFREDLVTREDADLFQRLNEIGRTYCARDLIVYHSARRAHNIGWPKLLSIWLFEAVYVKIFQKSFNAEWKAVR